MGRFKVILIVIVIYLMAQIVFAEPTAKTYIFAASQYMFYHPWYGGNPLDSLCKHFDVIIFHDWNRDTIPTIRDSTKVEWRRNNAPILLLYKDAMTICGPGRPWHPEPDPTIGGRETVGGYNHFDSLLKQNYPSDTFFMLATTVGSQQTSHYDTIVIGNDTLHRVKAGSDPSWQWRWAMAYGESYWRNFYACTTKVQCLRNYADTTYDDTYFDGVLIDNLLPLRSLHGLYPQQYPDNNSFREAVYSFTQTACSEYHNLTSPPGNPRSILGTGNLNYIYLTPLSDTVWKKLLHILDGGMEEGSDGLHRLSFNDWHRIMQEIAMAESLGKISFIREAVDSCEYDTIINPFGLLSFSSTNLMFGFTSYLMVFDSMAHFYFCPREGPHYAFICWAPVLDIDIGKPMGRYILTADTLAYRYYEGAAVFANPCSLSSVTAGFPGDTLLFIKTASCTVDVTIDQLILPSHTGVIGLYPLNYFQASGFEPDDRLCWENYCLEVEGVTNCYAKRVQGIPPNGVTPHSGQWMYKVYGQDESTDTSFVSFKVFPYDVLIEDPTYLSFWIYVEDAPGDSAPIGIDCLLKSGKRLSEWTKFGTILDQYGKEINPADRRVPEGAWYQYVFTFNPAVNETIDHIELVYDGSQISETGDFCAYIDDIEILTQFPILDTWYAEKFPVGSPINNPNNYDPNFYMNFIAQGDSVRLIINPQGDGGEGAHWVNPAPGIRNNITDISVDSFTTVIWSQYDKAHSLILSLFVHDNQENNRWLMYAKNASNWWPQTGWVDMGDTARHYNMWEGFFRNIRDDYTAEYGGEVEPESIIELRLEHFARSEWVGDSGGTIRNLFIVPFTQEFTINQNQTYTNMPYVALRTKVTSEIVDSMNIHQDYSDSLTDSTGWIAYDTSYCWYLREGEGNNTVYIQYKVGGFSESPVYCDTIIFDKTLT